MILHSPPRLHTRSCIASSRSRPRAALAACCLCAGIGFNAFAGALGAATTSGIVEEPPPAAAPGAPQTPPAKSKPTVNPDLETPRRDGALLSCKTTTPTIRPGDVVHVDVYLDSALTDLRGYQLHIAVSGGTGGSMELIDIAIHQRNALTPSVGPPAFWSAFNLGTKQMLAGMDTPGVTTRAHAYLGTFSFKASPDAAGDFVVEVLHDDSDPKQRTFLFPTPSGAKISITSAKPITITVADTPTENRQSSAGGE